MNEQLFVGIVVSAFLFLVVLLPRFNRWPEHETGSYKGKPWEYLSNGRCALYSICYLATFGFFALALSQLANFAEFIQNSSGDDAMGLALQLLGNNTFAAALVFLVVLLPAPWMNRLDERWRSFLLQLARVPKDALDLKNQLLDNLGELEFDRSRTEKLLGRLRPLGREGFWDKAISSGKGPGNLEYDVLIGLYLVSLVRNLRPTPVDTEDLSARETRLLEIAAVIPSIENEPASGAFQYQVEINVMVPLLVEMLAKYAIKRFPDPAGLHAELQEYGFSIEYRDKRGNEIEQPVLVSAISLLAACFIITMLGLLLFDLMGVRPPGDSVAWFEQSRILGWSFGGWLSFVMAIGFGVFFNEILRETFGSRAPLAYLLAFLFATLGGCIFFMVSPVDFSPAFLWLAVSFGLLSAVTIASLHRNSRDSAQVFHKAVALAVPFAVASMILQILVRVSFRGLDTSLTDITAFGVFGLLRGGAIGLLIAYLFLEYGRIYSLPCLRKSPRMQFGHEVNGELEGNETSVYVKDISAQGALVRVPEMTAPHEGDRVRLHFDFADLRGQVVWVKHHLARVRFNPDDPNLGLMKSYLAQKGPQATP